MLSESWKWSNQDHYLNVLPLHHVHGLVVGLLTCLYNGACNEFFNFSPEKVWN